MRNKLSLRREAQPHRGDAPLTPNGKPETFLASWVGDIIVANPGRACTNAAKPPLRPRFCTFSTSKPATFENVTVLHDTKPTFTFSNPRLLLQAAVLTWFNSDFKSWCEEWRDALILNLPGNQDRFLHEHYSEVVLVARYSIPLSR